MFNHFTNILTECGLLKKITSFCFIRQIYQTVNVIVSRLFPGDLKTWKWLSNRNPFSIQTSNFLIKYIYFVCKFLGGIYFSLLNMIPKFQQGS